MSNSPTIPGPLWGCCTRPWSSAGRSRLALASSQRPQAFLRRHKAAHTSPNVPTLESPLWRMTPMSDRTFALTA